MSSGIWGGEGGGRGGRRGEEYWISFHSNNANKLPVAHSNVIMCSGVGGGVNIGYPFIHDIATRASSQLV